MLRLRREYRYLCDSFISGPVLKDFRFCYYQVLVISSINCILVL